MKNVQIVNSAKETCSKIKDTGKTVIGWVFGLFIFGTATIIAVGGVMAQFSPSSNVEGLEKAYVVQVESAKKALDTACSIEVDLSKAKLTEHFSDIAVLSEEVIDRLTEKTKGKNLDCRSF